jgi:hypothetical protein
MEENGNTGTIRGEGKKMCMFWLMGKTMNEFLAPWTHACAEERKKIVIMTMI